MIKGRWSLAYKDNWLFHSFEGFDTDMKDGILQHNVNNGTVVFYSVHQFTFIKFEPEIPTPIQEKA